MMRWERYLWNTAAILVAVSGMGYFWMKHVMENDDPFSVLNHPWQPTVLALHLVAAPALVFAAGLIARSHVLNKLASGDRTHRRSGLATLTLLPVMIFSGYLLQVLSSPLPTATAWFAHLGSSAAFVVTGLAHQILSVRRVAPATRPSEGGSLRRIT